MPAPTRSSISTISSFTFNTARCRNVNGLAAALALAALPVSQAHAALGVPSFTATQNVIISGRYLPANPSNLPDPTLPIDHVPYNGSSLGSSTYDFSSVNGIQNGSVTWNSGIDAQGFVRTSSDMQINQTFFEGSAGFTDLNVEVTNFISYYDLIQSSDPGVHTWKFQTRLTGALSNTVTYGNLTDSGASSAIYDTRINFSSFLASTNGSSGQVQSLGDTYSNDLPAGGGRFTKNVDVPATMSVDIFFEEVGGLGGVFFGFDYFDVFLVDIENIDAGSIDIEMKNDLGSTVVTTANGYDINGNLLPNARAISTLTGATFAPNPVPLPAAAWLFISALAGLVVAKRKQPSA